MANWNPWHGCHKLSAGCANCYVYRGDGKYGRDSSIVEKNAQFDLPVRRKRGGEYAIPPGEEVFTCFTSDFLVEEADSWRQEAWQFMKQRRDLTFLFITKRIHRLEGCLPQDWGQGYPNVKICCTVENQDRADYRLPIFLRLPIAWKGIVCEPLLEPIELSPYLKGDVAQVVAGGESGPGARPCHYDWILDIRYQCVRAQTSFWFKQTGANFVKDGKSYQVPRKYQHAQARKAGISFLV